MHQRKASPPNENPTRRTGRSAPNGGGSEWRRLAVLVDAENVSPALAPRILAEARKHGAVKIRRAFDAVTLSRWVGVLVRHAFDTRQLAKVFARRWEDHDTLPDTGWMFPSGRSSTGRLEGLSQYYKRIGEASGTRFWYHGLRNAFITVAERDLMLPASLTKRLVNHAPPKDVTQSYAADWTIAQLREPAQKVADRIQALMMADPVAEAEAG